MIKKMQSKKQEAKKQKRKQLIIGLVLIFVMLGSAFGIVVNSFGEKETLNNIIYNDYEFINQNDFWILEKGNYTFMFRYNPEQVEKISGKVNYLTSYSGKPLYISSEDYVSEVEIYRNLGQFVQRFQKACLTEEGCEENLPIKNCSNNFVIISESEISNIIQDENCVFIQGPKENLTQISDEFLFKILDIE